MDQDSDSRDGSPSEFKLPSLEITMKNETAKRNLAAMIMNQTKIDFARQHKYIPNLEAKLRTIDNNGYIQEINTVSIDDWCFKLFYKWSTTLFIISR